MDHTVCVYDTDMCEIQCQLKEHKDRVVGTFHFLKKLLLIFIDFDVEIAFKCKIADDLVSSFPFNVNILSTGCTWHPTRAVLVTSGADSAVKFWVPTFNRLNHL